MDDMLAKAYTAEAPIGPYLIAKFGSADGTGVGAVAATDKPIGVTNRVNPTAIGDRFDVIRVGIAEVVYGGPVTRGDPLTSDALSRAVLAAPAAGTNAFIVGQAEVSGVLGDVGKVLVNFSVMRG